MQRYEDFSNRANFLATFCFFTSKMWSAAPQNVLRHNVTRHNKLLAEIDVHIVASFVAGIVHLLQTPVFAAVGGFEVEGSLAQAFLTAVDVVDFHGDGACEQQVVGIDNIDGAVDFQVVVVLARQLFALATQHALVVFCDVARAKVVPRNPL